MKISLLISIFIGSLFYTLTAQDYSIPATTDGWNQFYNASVSETTDGIIFGSAGYRDGNFIMTNDVFDLSGQTVKMKWRFNGGSERGYFRGSIRIYQTLLYISIPSDGVLADDTWCYTTLTINEDKTFSFNTATGNYLAEGGTIVGSAASGTCADGEWDGVTNAGILLG
ncbi:hypothetical protein OAA06_01225 [bacterium]|nr:hypothetical protein [bacterium]